MEEGAQRIGIGGMRRPNQYFGIVGELQAALFLDRIGMAGGEILIARNVAQLPGGLHQAIAVIWMRYFDHGKRPLADGFPEQIGDAIFGNDIMHVGARDADTVAGLERRLDA